MIQFTVLQTRAELESIQGPWQALANHSGHGLQLFQDAIWNVCWWEHFEATGRYSLRTLVGHQGDELVLVWPFVLHRSRGLRLLEPSGGLLSCYDDALIAKTVERNEALKQAWTVLLNEPADVIQFRAVHEQASVAEFLATHGGSAVGVTAAPAIPCADFKDFDEFLAARPKRFRKNQRRSWKMLRQAGELAGHGNDATMEPAAAVDQAIRFKRQWLTARGLSGKTLVSSEGHAFLRDVCARYARCQGVRTARVSTLTLDQQPISIGIGFHFVNRHYEYLGGFDQAFDKHGSGRVRMELGVQDCFRTSIHAYDMLTPATTFKAIWTDQTPTVRQYVVPLTARGRLYRGAYVRWLRPKLRRAYNALPKSVKQKFSELAVWG